MLEPTHRHIETGNSYKFIFHALDLTTQGRVVVCEGVGKRIWVIDRDEFDDFEVLPPSLEPRHEAWVIIDETSPSHKRLYLAGMDGLSRFRWAFDVARAVRFARREDAEMLADTGGHRVDRVNVI